MPPHQHSNVSLGGRKRELAINLRCFASVCLFFFFAKSPVVSISPCKLSSVVIRGIVQQYFFTARWLSVARWIPRSHQYINNIFCIGARARLLHGGLSTLVHLDLSSPLLHCLYLVSASFFFCGSSKPWQNRFFVKASGTGFPVKICVGASGQFYVVTFPGVSFLSLWELPSKKGTHRFACHLGDGLIS